MDAYGVTQVTRTLHLSGTDLNKRRGIIGAGRNREATGSETPFVEIDPVVMDQALGPGGDTPAEVAGGAPKLQTKLKYFLWQTHCRGLYQLPVAA